MGAGPLAGAQVRRAQRTVILLRDVEGWDGAQVSDALELTASNQRVLLHRARSKVRAALETGSRRRPCADRPRDCSSSSSG